MDEDQFEEALRLLAEKHPTLLDPMLREVLWDFWEQAFNEGYEACYERYISNPHGSLT